MIGYIIGHTFSFWLFEWSTAGTVIGSTAACIGGGFMGWFYE